MTEIHAEYNGDILTPEQIDMLHDGLLADLNEMAADDPVLELEDPEAEIG